MLKEDVESVDLFGKKSLDIDIKVLEWVLLNLLFL
jgi:hypothetical protein